MAVLSAGWGEFHLRPVCRGGMFVLIPLPLKGKSASPLRKNTGAVAHVRRRRGEVEMAAC